MKKLAAVLCLLSSFSTVSLASQFDREKLIFCSDSIQDAAIQASEDIGLKCPPKSFDLLLKSEAAQITDNKLSIKIHCKIDDDGAESELSDRAIMYADIDKKTGCITNPILEKLY